MRLIGKKYFLFFGFLLTAPKAKITEIDMNHEKIHSKQIAEVMFASLPVAILLWIFSNIWMAGFFVLASYYLWYVIEWAIHFARLKDAHLAYRRVSFEREAYENQNDLDYIKSRSWFKFIQFL